MKRRAHLRPAVARGLPLLVALVGCVPAADLELPPPPGGAVAAIVLVTPPDSIGTDALISGRATDAPQDLGRALTLPAHAVVTVLYFARTLESLRLAPGPLPSTAGLEHTRPLPAAIERWQTVIGEGGWSQISEALVPPIQLPAAFGEDCAIEGGCLDDQGLCARPCPVPDAPKPPVAPARITPPTERTCPDGWTLEGIEPSFLGGVLCVPALTIDDCPLGQYLSPRAGGCVALGTNCPDDQFGPEPPPGRVTLYVAPGAVAGTGARARPFGRLAEALAVAAGGERIILGRGRHEVEGQRLEGARDLRLEGVCARDTVLAGGLEVEGSTGIVLSNLRLVGAGRTAVDARSSVLSLEAVHVESSTIGVQARAASTVQLSAVRIDDGGSGGADAAGLLVEAGSRLMATDVAVAHVRGAGVLARGAGAEADLDDVVVYGARGIAGIWVTESGRLIGQRLGVSGSAGSGLRVDRGAAAVVDHLAVSEVLGQVFDAGLVVDAATATVSFLRIERAAPEGVAARSGARVALSDALVLDAAGEHPDAHVRITDSDATLARVLVEGSGERAVVVERGRLQAADLGIAAAPDRVGIHDGLTGADSEVTVERLEVLRAARHAVELVSSDEARSTHGALFDVFVSDTSIADAPRASHVIRVNARSQLHLTRAELLDSAPTAIDALRGGELVLTDVRVRNTSYTGLSVRAGAKCRGERVRIEGATMEGVYAAAEGLATASVSLDDLTIEGPDPTKGLRTLTGLKSLDASIVEIRGFSIRRTTTAAVVGQEATKLHHGDIDEADLGLQVSGALTELAAEQLFHFVRFGPQVTQIFSRL